MSSVVRVYGFVLFVARCKGLLIKTQCKTQSRSVFITLVAAVNYNLQWEIKNQ